MATEYDKSISSAYRKFFSLDDRWELFVTIRLRNSDYLFYLKEIRNAILRKTHGQIAYTGIFVEYVKGYYSPHLHLLMFGRARDKGTLRDMDLAAWPDMIGDIIRNRSGVRIQRINSPAELSNVIWYITGPRNTGGRHELIPTWGRIARPKDPEIAPDGVFDRKDRHTPMDAL